MIAGHPSPQPTSVFESADAGDTANATSDATNKHGDIISQHSPIAPTPGDTKSPSTTGSHNKNSNLDRTPPRKQGGALPPRASVLTTAGSPAAVRGKLVRSSSVSTSTDIDSEIRKKLQKKYPVVLRSKSVSCEDYTDTQPRSKKRPKSAVIIEPSGDGETVLMCEVEVRRNTGNKAAKLHRRSSMEIDLNSLAKSGLLLQSNLQQANSPSTPVALPAILRNQSSPVKTKAFGSAANLRAGDRTSVVSIESLDPRTMISGQLHENSHTFNTSIGSDLTNSVRQLPSFASPQWNRAAKEPRRKGNLNVPENGLQPGQRSMSMDTLAVNRNKGESNSPHTLSKEPVL